MTSDEGTSTNPAAALTDGHQVRVSIMPRAPHRVFQVCLARLLDSCRCPVPSPQGQRCTVSRSGCLAAIVWPSVFIATQAPTVKTPATPNGLPAADGDYAQWQVSPTKWLAVAGADAQATVSFATFWFWTSRLWRLGRLPYLLLGCCFLVRCEVRSIGITTRFLSFCVCSCL